MHKVESARRYVEKLKELQGPYIYVLRRAALDAAQEAYLAGYNRARTDVAAKRRAARRARK